MAHDERNGGNSGGQFGHSEFEMLFSHPRGADGKASGSHWSSRLALGRSLGVMCLGSYAQVMHLLSSPPCVMPSTWSWGNSHLGSPCPQESRQPPPMLAFRGGGYTRGFSFTDEIPPPGYQRPELGVHRCCLQIAGPRKEALLGSPPLPSLQGVPGLGAEKQVYPTWKGFLEAKSNFRGLSEDFV